MDRRSPQRMLLLDSTLVLLNVCIQRALVGMARGPLGQHWAMLDELIAGNAEAATGLRALGAHLDQSPRMCRVNPGKVRSDQPVVGGVASLDQAAVPVDAQDQRLLIEAAP